MPDAWQDLAGALTTALEGVNVYEQPPSGVLTIPAAVVAPDAPWLEPGKTFSTNTERYAVWAVVHQSAPMGALYALAQSIVAAVRADGRFRYTNTDSPRLVRVAGVDYLAAAVRLVTEV